MARAGFFCNLKERVRCRLASCAGFPVKHQSAAARLHHKARRGAQLLLWAQQLSHGLGLQAAKRQLGVWSQRLEHSSCPCSQARACVCCVEGAPTPPLCLQPTMCREAQPAAGCGPSSARLILAPRLPTLAVQVLEGGDFVCPGSVIPDRCAFEDVRDAINICSSMAACRSVVQFHNGTDGCSSPLAVLTTSWPTGQNSYVAPTVDVLTKNSDSMVRTGLVSGADCSGGSAGRWRCSTGWQDVPLWPLPCMAQPINTTPPVCAGVDAADRPGRHRPAAQRS